MDQLGPFQHIWNAWDEAQDEIRDKPRDYFRRVIQVQLDELDSHLDAEDREAAAREAIDIISVTLNLLRWMKYEPEEIAIITRSRAERRMNGQVLEILEKYRMHEN